MMTDTDKNFFDHDDALIGRIRASMDGDRLATVQRQAQFHDKYVQLPRDKDLDVEIGRLLENAAAAHDHPREGRLLVVTGSSGEGKTMAIRRALDRRRALLGGDDSGLILGMTAPSPCTLKQLGRALLSELGYPLGRDLREHVTWERVRAQLRVSNTIIVWIDELQHAVGAMRNDLEVQKLCDTIKNVVQQPGWPPVSFILSGLPSVIDFICSDRQIERRCRLIRFEGVRFPEHTTPLRAMVTTMIERHAGLAVGDLLTDEFIHRLCHAATGAFGLLMTLTYDAISRALETPSRQILTIGDFATAYAATTGCAPDQNIFTAPDWHLIDRWAAKRRDDEPAFPDVELRTPAPKRRTAK
jgi:hypothetical protein